MKLFTSAFSEGGMIPPKYTCNGENVSPPLEWSDLPPQTNSLALIVDDPDAPSGLFVHWLIYNLSPEENGLTEAVGIAADQAGGALQGVNGFKKSGYGGPCPPSGTHRYYFHLYALDSKPDLPAGASRNQLDTAMHGHIIAEAQLMGRYQKH
jgi:Raf kinase inhibitor-like YbhB/YbcL family protein